ncbi:MAG: ribosome small subunit-dependent GTPase A [Acidobacteriota bacterium]|nr:ribosome small subunit-dependent GTPase A [Acidobacteriota bacterium]
MAEHRRPDDEIGDDRWDHLAEEHGPSYEKHAWKRGRKGPRKRSAGKVESQGPPAQVLTVGARRCTVLWREEKVPCRLPSSLSVNQQAEVAVGDRVLVEKDRGTCWVREVQPRDTVLSRPDPRNPRLQRIIAANMDTVVIVVAARRPGIRPGLIDRYLLAVEHGGARPVICLNKIDLVPPEERSADPELALAQPYRDLGLEVVLCSAKEERGLDALRAALHDQLCVFVGHSGVGKSSLINALHPKLDLDTSPVRERDGTGQHTTTRSNLFELDEGIRVIDTPGVREFGLWNLEPAQVRQSFEEFLPHAAACRFTDCTHTHEPQCGVREAVAAGEIPEQRYEAYRRILDSLEE